MWWRTNARSSSGDMVDGSEAEASRQVLQADAEAVEIGVVVRVKTTRCQNDDDDHYANDKQPDVDPSDNLGCGVEAVTTEATARLVDLLLRVPSEHDGHNCPDR